jgi:hypothetical protein
MGARVRLRLGPMPYRAENTGRMQLRGHPGPFELKIHELRDDGQPRCGPKPGTWRGQPMDLVALGAGDVTCERCAQITDH